MGKFASTFSKAFGSVVAKGKRYGPELGLIFGIGGVISGTILACRATWFAKDDIINANDDILLLEAQNIHAENPLTTEELEVEKKKIKKKMVLKVIKRYVGPVAIEAAGIGLTIAGHGVQKSRYSKLASAYSIVSGSYARYRDRVKEKYGDDVDRELRYGVKEEKVTEVDENGEKTTKVVKTSEYDGKSDFARYFTKETSKLWRPDKDLNRATLRMLESQANNRLQASAYENKIYGIGVLTFNDLCDMCGFDRTDEGAIMGWTFYKDGKNYNGGANCISFGLDYEEAELNPLLIFNVDPMPVTGYYPPQRIGGKK